MQHLMRSLGRDA